MSRFSGAYNRILNIKGRICLPRSLAIKENTELVLVKKADHVDVWLESDWVERIPKTPVEKREMLMRSEGKMVDCKCRILLSKELILSAGFERDSTVLLVGVGDHLEIWTADNWEKHRALRK